jgi:hypothetical protein
MLDGNWAQPPLPLTWMGGSSGAACVCLCGWRIALLLQLRPRLLVHFLLCVEPPVSGGKVLLCGRPPELDRVWLGSVWNLACSPGFMFR